MRVVTSLPLLIALLVLSTCSRLEPSANRRMGAMIGKWREAAGAPGGADPPPGLVGPSEKPNLFFLHLFDPMEKRTPTADYLVGDQGVLLAITMLILAFVAVRREGGVARKQVPVIASGTAS